MKMSLKLVAAAAAVASAFALSACGDKKEAAPAKPATPAAPAAQSKAAEPLKVGFVYVAPIADVGYTKQHDIGRIYAIDKVEIKSRRHSWRMFLKLLTQNELFVRWLPTATS